MNFADAEGHINKKHIHHLAGNDAEVFSCKIVEALELPEIQILTKLIANTYCKASNEEFIYFLSFTGKMYDLGMESSGICFL